jgi:hypothetical protein
MRPLLRVPRPVLRAGLLLLLLVLVPAGPTATAAVRAASGPSVTASPASGPVGSTTTVAGRGFPARAPGTVVLGAASVAVRTDGKGASAPP